MLTVGGREGGRGRGKGGTTLLMGGGKEEERKERDEVGRSLAGREGTNLGGGRRGRTGEKRKEPTDEGATATVLLPNFCSPSPLTARVCS